MAYPENFGHSIPAPHNPEDPGRGCIGVIGIALLIILYCITVLCSCSTSEKTQKVVSTSDSLTVVTATAQGTHATDSVSLMQSQVQWHRDTTFTDITLMEAETVNEQITENIDSLGRVTSRTTNRTTTRNTSKKDNTVSVSEDLSASEQLAVFLSRLDSLAAEYAMRNEVHHADSLSNIQRPSPVAPLPWWIRLAYFISDLMGYAVFAFLIVGSGALIYRYVKGK